MLEATMLEATMLEATIQEPYDAGSSQCGTHAVSNERWRIVIFGPGDTIERCLVDGLARLPQQQEPETEMFRLR